MQQVLHVVSLPHTQVTRDFQSCAFTQKVRRFCIMMRRRGYRVVLYAGDEIDIEVDEHVSCIADGEAEAMYAPNHYTSVDWGHPTWAAFNERVVDEMRSRIAPQDFICLITGCAAKPI